MSYQKLREALEPNTPTSFYLALLPQHYPLAIQGIATNGLLQADSEVILEKPVATTQAKAQTLLNLLRELQIENQASLVEHFNLKESLSNALHFRLSTPFEAWLNRDNVKGIRIYALEKITVPNERVPFFDSIRSQLRDMITHLLAMSYPLLIDLPPEGLEVASLRRQKEKIAQSLRVVDADTAVWGQYQGYPTPTTSTFTAFTLECDTPRWKGVTIKVVTGKGLPEKYCGMEVIFREQSQVKNLFSNIAPRLVFRHYPNEGIAFYFPVKRPGAGRQLVPAKMEFTYQSAFQQVNQPAYLRLLADICAGDKSSFASPLEALQALRIADQLEAGGHSLVKYQVGTYPEEAKDWLPSEAEWL
ncbi:hypothetical protein [Kamptonema formosum]|uniref:hypothetical protein n=1 Tax=Kamptonema formosum TaxID=331992 RepID=UPI000349AFDA|nr:hypothetical protein [Oscillatoria sp. PCC 10802]